MKVVWSTDAVLRLAQIEERRAHFDPDSAARLVARLIDRTDLLEENPMLGRIVPEVEALQLRELVEDGFRIIYRLRPDSVEIVTVVHSRMSLDRG